MDDTKELATASSEEISSTKEITFKDELLNPSGEAKEEVSTPETEQSPSEETEKTYSQEEFTRQVQSEADKRVKTYQDKIRSLELKLAEKQDNEDIKALYEDDIEKGDEEKARRRNESLKRLMERTRNIDEREIRSKQQVESLAEKEVSLMAKEDMLALEKVDDKALQKRIDKGVKRLLEADSRKEYNLILNEIKREYEGKKESFKPDSSRTSAGGKRVFTREEINKMTDDEYTKNREDIRKAQLEGRIK